MAKLCSALLGLLLTCVCVFGQESPDNRTADRTFPFRVSSRFAGQCALGQFFYLSTGEPGDGNGALYKCDPDNTWVLQASGTGSSASGNSVSAVQYSVSISGGSSICIPNLTGGCSGFSGTVLAPHGQGALAVPVAMLNASGVAFSADFSRGASNGFSPGDLVFSVATTFAGTIEIGSGGGTSVFVGPLSTFPSTCITNGLYYGFATDATAGLNLYYATSAGPPCVWTAQGATNTVGGNQTAGTYSTNGVNSGSWCPQAKTSMSVVCFSIPDTIASGGTLQPPVMGGSTYVIGTGGGDLSCATAPCTVTGVNGQAVPASITQFVTNAMGQFVNGVLTSNVLNQSTSQSSPVTVWSSPGAGNYSLRYYVSLNNPCTTGSNSVSFTFNWTDAGSARSLTTSSFTMGSTQTASGYINGMFPFRVNSGNVTYTSTVVGTCSTGTSSYDIHVWAEEN